MEMNRFVASCLFMDGDVFDECCNNFGIDISEFDVYEALDACNGDYKNFGIIILEKMWSYVVQKYSIFLDEEKFDCDCTSPSYPSFFYNKKEVYCENDLIEIIRKNRKSMITRDYLRKQGFICDICSPDGVDDFF